MDDFFQKSWSLKLRVPFSKDICQKPTKPTVNMKRTASVMKRGYVSHQEGARNVPGTATASNIKLGNQTNRSGRDAYRGSGGAARQNVTPCLKWSQAGRTEREEGQVKSNASGSSLPDREEISSSTTEVLEQRV